MFVPAAFGSQPTQLFIIAHNKNANVVRYETNTGSDGKLNPAAPVRAYWLMLSEDGRKKELTSLDKKAYGFNCELDKNEGVYKLTIRSYKKRKIKILPGTKQFEAQMAINGKQSYLKKVYIYATHTFVVPKVRYMELFGKDKSSGKNVHEKISI